MCTYLVVQQWMFHKIWNKFNGKLVRCGKDLSLLRKKIMSKSTTQTLLSKNVFKTRYLRVLLSLTSLHPPNTPSILRSNERLLS